MSKSLQQSWQRRRPRFAVEYPRLVTVDTQAEAANLAEPGGVIALVRGPQHPKWLVLRCPCGCGQLRRVSTSSSVEPSWQLRIDHGGEASLFPSVWLTGECRAHFVLRRNRAYVY